MVPRGLNSMTRTRANVGSRLVDDGRSPPDVLCVVRRVSSYPDVSESLRRLEHAGAIRAGNLIEIDPSGTREHQASGQQQVIAHVAAHRTECVVLHHFHSPRLADPRAMIRLLRELPHRPVVVLTNGDAFYDGATGPRLPLMMRQAAEEVDAIMSTSMGRLADQLHRPAGGRVAFLPWGLCQARFRMTPSARPRAAEFRVVFIGSNNRPRSPLRRYHWYARRRERLVRHLGRKFGTGFAIFGHGWDGVPGWQGPVPFADQQLACQRADLVVGGVPFSPARYYHSDRIFAQIASGVPFIDLAVDGIETILRDGEHWHLAHSIGEVVDRCDELLCRPAAERAELGAEAASFVRTRHSVEDRFRSLLRTMVGLRQSLTEAGPLSPPDLDFFLPEVDLSSEFHAATRGWS
jgi:hypothetical protein